jgi:glycosyltransferase involved in cell wall biosynthesis
MKILFISPYPVQGGSSRFRIYQYLPFLRARGHEVAVSAFLSEKSYQIVYQPGKFFHKAAAILAGLWRRLVLLPSLQRYDLCIIHREASPLGPGLVEWLAAKFSRRLIYDFDDAVFEPNVSPVNRFFAFLKSTQKISRLISQCDAVIAGNDYLESYAKQFCPRSFVLPTPVDVRRFMPRDHKSQQPVVIGWIGSHTTAPYLSLVADALKSLKAEFGQRVEIEIVGAGEFRFNDVLARYKPWALEREPEDVQHFDIGIMPMPDNRWTRGKCGFKALLYMSVGAPVVCSPVGINREIVVSGENGFWAETSSQWHEALRQLVEYPTQRRKMGERCRQLVEEKFSLEKCAERLEAILRAVVNESIS